MNISVVNFNRTLTYFLTISMLLMCFEGFTQRRPGTRRPATTRPTTRPAARPATRPASRPASRPATTRNRPVAKPQNNTRNRTATARPSTRPAVNKKSDINKDKINVDRDKINVDRDKINIDRDKINVDNSKRNVNINIDNSKNYSRNTVVRRNVNRPYTRPPHIYGGFRYHCYHPYFPRPYRPFYWGPLWHPWGFFVTTLAVTAIVVSVNNTQYHYDNGVWYEPSNNGYQVVPAPVGGTVNNLPDGTQTINNGTTVNNYYYGGSYYEKSGDGYTVVAPEAGTLVENLPDGGEEVTLGDVKYIKFGETYYQPVQVDGKDMYEVVLVEKDS